MFAMKKGVARTAASEPETVFGKEWHPWAWQIILQKYFISYNNI